MRGFRPPTFLLDAMNLDDIEISQNHCFVTSVFEIQLATGAALEALNRELLGHIHAIRDRGESGRDYEGAGWQTPHDLHARPEFGALFEAVHRVMVECSRAESVPDAQRPVVHSAWSNIERRGDFVRVHMHPWAVWSGVYYVQADELAGDIYFEDPRPAAKALSWPHAGGLARNTVSFRPQPGMLLLFPSWLEHYTDPSRSERERVCIAFNASLGAPHRVPQMGL